MDFLLRKSYLFSPQFETKEIGIFGEGAHAALLWSEKVTCFVVECCGGIQKF